MIHGARELESGWKLTEQLTAGPEAAYLLSLCPVVDFDLGPAPKGPVRMENDPVILWPFVGLKVGPSLSAQSQPGLPF